MPEIVYEIPHFGPIWASACHEAVARRRAYTCHEEEERATSKTSEEGIRGLARESSSIDRSIDRTERTLLAVAMREDCARPRQRIKIRRFHLLHQISVVKLRT